MPTASKIPANVMKNEITSILSGNGIEEQERSASKLQAHLRREKNCCVSNRQCCSRNQGKKYENHELNSAKNLLKLNTV